ncbi:Quinone oxidoreductase (NADPH:quinone reductase) [Legionella wadsworthii]|uniref:Quinone oxidoreductase (NADPH:quinone reductase) n=1 Tax=Legionella wadsworthii TaxID=28088 RepID=A0A378LPN0_9GAMM|nr:zinc-dependent alcohol dehydrogenase family protein [Legionella wadsworthii]STY28647.1 Quinone oxidoreductase (NADPH:quinone reductase) [Legionella wadsworthii]
MKAQAISSFGDSSVFKTIKISKPKIKPGYVLIRVVATSVNPVDCKVRSGKYGQIAPAFPAILHGDVAGVIEDIGQDVSGFAVGDEVYGCAGGFLGENGALAEYMLADAQLIAKKPRKLSMVEAAALPLVSITAWEALFEKIKVQAGQKVLIHAGTGGVGHVAIQLAKSAGAEVYTTVSSSDKGDIAKSLGAKDTINYRLESVQDYVNRLTHGEGFDVVFDTIGGENLDKSMEAVAMYGNVISIQAASSHDLSPLHAKSASLHAVFMLLPLLHHVQRQRHGDILKEIAMLVDKGNLKPLIDPHLFYFENIDKAHSLLESGKAVGKIVVQAY